MWLRMKHKLLLPGFLHVSLLVGEEYQEVLPLGHLNPHILPCLHWVSEGFLLMVFRVNYFSQDDNSSFCLLVPEHENPKGLRGKLWPELQ